MIQEVFLRTTEPIGSVVTSVKIEETEKRKPVGKEKPLEGTVVVSAEETPKEDNSVNPLAFTVFRTSEKEVDYRKVTKGSKVDTPGIQIDLVVVIKGS